MDSYFICILVTMFEKYTVVHGNLNVHTAKINTSNTKLYNNYSAQKFEPVCIIISRMIQIG